MRARSNFEPLAEYVPIPPHIASALPDDFQGMAGGLSDDEALKKIGQRSTTSGKVITAALILGVLGLGAFYVQRSRTYDARMDGIDAAGQLERPAMLAALRQELEENDYPDVQVRAIRNLSHFRDTEAIPLFIEALKQPGIVRRAAALALANLGSPAADAAKPALLAALPDTDAKDRPQVVWALAVLKESQATDAILEEFTRGLLQHQPGFDPKVITEALGIERLSSPELTAHPKKAVRTLVAVALAEAASPEVVPPLVRMLERPDEDTEVVRAVVAGLGRAGDPRAAGPLFKLMNEQPSLRQSVLDALGRSTAAPELATLMKEAKDRDVLRDMVNLLRKTHDPRSADPFASLLQVQDEKVRIEAALALADLGDPRCVPVLLELAKSPDDKMGNDALDGLRTVGHPSAGKALIALLPQFPARKAAIMRAIGTSGATEAGPMIMKELKGDDIGAATKALGQLKYERAYPVLLKMLKRDPKVDFSKPGVPSEMAYRNRLEAMVGLSYFGRLEPKLVQMLTTIIEDPVDDKRLRAKAGETLGQLATPEVYAQMVQRIQAAGLEEFTRVAYVQGLYRRPDPAMSERLVSVLSNAEQPGTVRRAAGLAVGYAGNPANDEPLLQLLDNPDARRYAAFAVALGGNEAGANKLLAVLQEDNDAEEILRAAVGSNESDDFSLLTAAMFESGQIFRRLNVARIMNEGTAEIAYTYLWSHVTARLSAGWDGPGGMSAREVRNALFGVLQGPDLDHRVLAAAALGSMNERGLLLAARDAGIAEAREQLMSMDRPRDPGSS